MLSRLRYLEIEYPTTADLDGYDEFHAWQRREVSRRLGRSRRA
jgi:hypothetical protein